MSRIAIFLSFLALAGCDDARETVRVFAASSMNPAMSELARAFERDHPDARVEVSYAGSQVLRMQIEHGARADLFVSANGAHASALTRAGLSDEARPLCETEMALIVPRDNPAKITRFAELALAERVVVGTKEVPVGIYAREVLKRAQIEPNLASLEVNARLVRAKVELGEADAALVYQSDVNDRVVALEIPARFNVRALYTLSTLKGARGEAFATFLLSEAGQKVLLAHGFSRVTP